MISWNNLDTLSSFKNLADSRKVNLASVMSGSEGAERVRKYSIRMAEGLSFNYAAKAVDDDIISRLQALADEARRVLDAEGELTLEKAWRRGGSSGGTRPKVYMAHEGEEWLVKFADRTDPPEVGRLEYETSLVARQCGIEMEPTRLFEGRFFGTRRFDRTADGGKVHVVSLSGLMGIDYRMPNADYGHLFWACNELTHSQKELWKVFRLMAFNLLIGNCDDHPKNFAFVHRDGLWHLAPAYDLLPCEGRNGMHALSVNRNYRNPGRSDALALATAFGLAGDEAAAVWDDMQAIVAQSGLLGWQK